MLFGARDLQLILPVLVLSEVRRLLCERYVQCMLIMRAHLLAPVQT